MESRLIVTHCLALLNEHAGAMSQADKDFFDQRVEQVQQEASDIFIAVLLLLTMRLSLDLPQEEAQQTAMQLAQLQEERFGIARSA